MSPGFLRISIKYAAEMNVCVYNDVIINAFLLSHCRHHFVLLLCRAYISCQTQGMRQGTPDGQLPAKAWKNMHIP